MIVALSTPEAKPRSICWTFYVLCHECAVITKHKVGFKLYVINVIFVTEKLSLTGFTPSVLHKLQYRISKISY